MPRHHAGGFTEAGNQAKRLFIMKTRKASGRILLIVVAALSAAFMAYGCSPQGVKDKEAELKPLVWPSSPEPARIAHLKTIATPDDIGANKGFFSRILDYVLGSTNQEIIKPYGVTTDSKGRLLVADAGYKRVHIFDMNKNSYDTIDNAGDLRLSSPIGVAADGDDNIYVTDSALQKVFVFDKKGEFLFPIEAGEKPTGIALNRQAKRIYVVDTGTHSVSIYDLKGKVIKNFGVLGGGKGGEFNYPVDISIDKNGDVYVVDAMNYKVQIFDKDGKFLSMFGHQGDGTGDFGRPKGVGVDRDGNIYVADALFDTVQIFDRGGVFLLNFGAIGNDRGAFWMPTGLYVDAGNKVYVADSYNKRVQIFEYIGGRN